VHRATSRTSVLGRLPRPAIAMERARPILAVVGLLAGVGAASIMLGNEVRPRGGEVVLVLAVGWSFIASGLVAWRLRPDNPIGLAMVVTGLLRFAEAPFWSQDPFLFTLGHAVGYLYMAGLVYIVLAFPTGWLKTPVRRGVFIAAAVAAGALQVAWLLTGGHEQSGSCAACPANLLEVTHAPALAAAIQTTQLVTGALVAALAIAVVLRRWWSASAPLRFAITPVIWVGIATLAALVVMLLNHLSGDPLGVVPHLGLDLTLALVALVAAGLAYAAGFSQAVLLLALAPALFAWQLQELGRRMLYTEGRLAAAFANDVLSYGGQAFALVLLWQLDLLTGARALLTLAAAFALGAVLVAWQLRSTLSGKLERSALSANWHFGKWLGVAEVGQWFSTQFYIYLAAAVIGAVASAALKAAQTLLGPISVFLTFVTSYLPIVLARELESSGSIRGKVRRSLAAILPVVVPYCVVIGLLAEPALELVYGSEYGQYAEVVQLFALYYVVLAFSTVAIAALSARGMTRDVFVGQAAGAALSLAIGWLLLRELGTAGGVVGMLLSWALAMALFLRALRAAPPGRSASVATAHARVTTPSEL